MLQLRPYQREALDALYAYWDNEGGSPIIVLPTGAGKSLVVATLMQELIRDYPDMRILCVTHVKELLVQNLQELLGLWPFAPAGLFSAGLGQRDAHSQIIFGGVQTIANKAHVIGHIDLVLVDEAHLVPRKADTQYGKLLAALRAINPDMRMAGLTATDYRLGEGRLTEGEGPMFDAVAFEKPVGELIDEGYLCRPVSKGMATGYDLDGVGKVGGDYNQGKLQAAVDREAVTRAAIDEVMRYGDDIKAPRKSWLLFCAGVEHAYHMRDEIRSRGITCETVAGETPAPDRDRILADFKAGRIRAVTNNSVLTTGFNHPGVDLLALCRPTLSTSLYIQMIGRGLRNAPGKENCLILDFAGCVRKHGPIDCVTVKKPGKGEGEAPVKQCPECESLVHASAKVCQDCGYEFPPNEEAKHSAQADITPVLSTAPPVWHTVTGRHFREHPPKPGKPPSVRCDYRMGLNVQKEWLCPEHQGYAQAKAHRFWKMHGGKLPLPRSVNEWLDRAGELLTTAEIQLRPNGKYQDVIGWRAGSAQVEAAPEPANDNWKPLKAAGESWSDEVPF
jgi:DNA repair protein RadD